MNLTTDMTKEQISKILKSIKPNEIKELSKKDSVGCYYNNLNKLNSCFYLYEYGEKCKGYLYKVFVCERINVAIGTCEEHSTKQIIIDNYFSKGIY